MFLDRYETLSYSLPMTMGEERGHKQRTGGDKDIVGSFSALSKPVMFSLNHTAVV